MVKAGKRGKVKQVQIQLYQDQVVELDRIAEDKGISRSHLLRMLVDTLIRQDSKG